MRQGSIGRRTHFAVAFAAEGDGGGASDGDDARGGVGGRAFGAGGEESAIRALASGRMVVPSR